MYTEALNIRLLETEGNCSMKDFLITVKAKDLNFTLTYLMKLEDGEISDIYTLALQF